ncbi:MAG: hypothetical protein ABR97_11805 [Rhodobacter sp. BACL10 MAG-120419-bin15]|nr:MAG: hypothetical protein ABR97_11805 [Rhodobacter sp. BACL10 MAG-120419-bin15]
MPHEQILKLPREFAQKGYHILPQTPDLLAYAQAAHKAGLGVLAQDQTPWRCGGTWFVGVDALPNGPFGQLEGIDFPFYSCGLALQRLHLGQLSVVKPGYPRPSEQETAAAFAYRRDFDGAHIDGILPIGAQKRRMIKEPHAFILGIALNDCAPDASPLVVWEGSHLIMAQALTESLAPFAPQHWPDCDITKAYQEARRTVFATCRRVPLPLKMGEASFLHRLTLHGVAPWTAMQHPPREGRMIAYFRPELPNIASWILT